LKARKATPLARIELLILDVDGVLTDGRLYFAARGEALKVFHVRDGHGIKLLLTAGIAVAAVSGRRSAAVAARMRELGVPHVIQACSDKVAALHKRRHPRSAADVGGRPRGRGVGRSSRGVVRRTLDRQGARRPRRRS
jgi:3-deoxy-D-manno-octulosonate 8-phosphate phosphatase KdsC-like HAD superfamily phosphatase